MRRTLGLASILLVVIALAAFNTASPINAATWVSGHPCPPGVTTYYVHRGDTAWDKTGGPDWETGWEYLVTQNPRLADRPIVRRSADDIFVLLREGEPICGLEGSGLVIRDGHGDIVAPSAEPSAPLNEPATPSTTVQTQEVPAISFTIPSWVWWLIGIILLALLAWWWWRFTHPTTAGDPLRTRGLDPLDQGAVTAWTVILGQHRYGQLAGPQDSNRPRLVGNIETGVLNGIGRVRYHGRNNSSVRLMRNEPGFRAWFQMPNGTREQLVFLQGCGNDVTFSGLRYTGFTFTPTGVAATIPAPQPTPPAPAPLLPTPIPAYTLAMWRARLEHMKLAEIAPTRATEHMHFSSLEEDGWVVTVLDELRYEDEQRAARRSQYETSATRARERAEALRAKAAGHDRAAQGYDHAANTMWQQHLDLQTDIDLVGPLPETSAGPDQDAAGSEKPRVPVDGGCERLAPIPFGKHPLPPYDEC